MNDTVNVRLRYAVTGNLSAAKRSLRDTFRPEQGTVERVSGVSAQGEYAARLLTVDINPDEVSNYRTYETFLVAMFLENNNDQGSHDAMRMLSRQALNRETESADPSARSEAVVWLADELEHLVGETYLDRDDREMTCRTDTDRLGYSLLTAALERVDWIELADCYLGSARLGA